MKVLDPGHMYTLECGLPVVFVKKVRDPDQPDGPLKQEHFGTNSEELLEVLIHRIGVLQEAVPCDENDEALYYLRAARFSLLKRTARRQMQGIKGYQRAVAVERDARRQMQGINGTAAVDC